LWTVRRRPRPPLWAGSKACGARGRSEVEGMVKRIWKEIKGVDLEGWFRVMPYEVAMDVVSAAWRGAARLQSLSVSVCCQEALMIQYGSDKPDTRFEMYVSASHVHVFPELCGCAEPLDLANRVLPCLVGRVARPNPARSEPVHGRVDDHSPGACQGAGPPVAHCGE
jgi:hypothetical protein